MREILFRGKRTDNGEWFDGFYAKSGEKAYIIYDNEIAIAYVSMKEVFPETVGQYTGETDRNEKKIFEGDIVKVYARGYHTICTVSWAEVVAHFQLWQINTIPHTPTALNLGNYDCEVIGNIYDNPELLGGGSND